MLFTPEFSRTALAHLHMDVAQIASKTEPCTSLLTLWLFFLPNQQQS